MNNKAIIELGFRRIWRILQISEDVNHLGLRPLWITLSLICSLDPTQPRSIIAKYSTSYSFRASRVGEHGKIISNETLRAEATKHCRRSFIISGHFGVHHWSVELTGFPSVRRYIPCTSGSSNASWKNKNILNQAYKYRRQLIVHVQQARYWWN